MANRNDARKALGEDLRAVVDDLKALLEDPKERKRKERRWRALYGALALTLTLAGRRVAVRLFGILTGEQPPAKGQQQAPREAEGRTEAPTSV